MSLFAALPLWLPCVVTAPYAQAPVAAIGDVGVWHWLAFGALVLGLLVLDLSVFHRQAAAPTFRESALWTVVWCSLAVAFDLLLWWWRGGTDAVCFMTGYLLEWSLSMDNVFVFAVLFNSYFLVPLKYQYRVLFWGILGAIVLRLTFVLLGAAALKYAAWILPLFGLVLIWQALKLGLQGSHNIDPERTIVMRLARRWLPVAQQDHGDRFVAWEAGRRVITPLLLVLLVIEWTDVVFAVDSVPAIFGITQDPFIVFTSNIFAILGLRALYFMLAGATDMFRFLKYGLAGVLFFIGFKMVLEYIAHGIFWRPELLPSDEHVIGPVASLVVVVALIGASVAGSLLYPHPAPAAGGETASAGNEDQAIVATGHDEQVSDVSGSA